MDDFDDKMDDFFTYSIVSGEFDNDEKASKRKEDSKGNESQESSSNYSSRRWSSSTIGKTTKRTPKKEKGRDSSIEKTNDDIHQKGKENDNWKIYVVVGAWLLVILCMICEELFLSE